MAFAKGEQRDDSPEQQQADQQGPPPLRLHIQQEIDDPPHKIRPNRLLIVRKAHKHCAPAPGCVSSLASPALFTSSRRDRHVQPSVRLPRPRQAFGNPGRDRSGA
ncbi:hypothetical protein D3C81_1572570 [compost metagenome]